MQASDYVGIGTLITATSAAVVSIIVALKQSDARNAVARVEAQVDTPGAMSLGETMAHVHDVVCNERVDNGKGSQP